MSRSVTAIAWRAVPLVALWLLAWGEVSVGNVVSGAVVAVALLLAFPPRVSGEPRPRFRLGGILRLLGYVVVQLVVSNLLVAREVVSRRSRVQTGVLAHHVRHPSDAVLTAMANIIALSPGTMTVDVTRDPAVVYVHFLILDDLEDARRDVARLERLVVDALGGPPDPGASP
jgi:multicomponent Na+:H+ antiporter subunit E